MADWTCGGQVFDPATGQGGIEQDQGSPRGHAVGLLERELESHQELDQADEV